MVPVMGISISAGGNAGVVSTATEDGKDFSLASEIVVGDNFVSMHRESTGDATITEKAGKFSLAANVGDKSSSEYIVSGDQVTGEVKQSGMTILGPDDIGYLAANPDAGIAVQGSGAYALSYVAGLVKPLHLNGQRITMTVVEPAAGTAPISGSSTVWYANQAKESLNLQEAQDMGAGRGTMSSQFFYQTRADRKLYIVTPSLQTTYYMTGISIRDSNNHNDGYNTVDWKTLSTNYNALSTQRYNSASHILENDVAINNVVGWSDQKLLSVLEHEMGHGAGLADEYTDPTQLMYYSWTGQGLTLGDGDHAGIRALYGPGGVIYQ